MQAPVFQGRVEFLFWGSTQDSNQRPHTQAARKRHVSWGRHQSSSDSQGERGSKEKRRGTGSPGGWSISRGHEKDGVLPTGRSGILKTE